MKTCTKCGEEKSLDEFQRSGKYYKSWCKVCLRKAAKERYYLNREVILAKDKERRQRNPEESRKKQRDEYHSNPKKTREYNLKRYFGITLDQYNELLAKQEGGCAICKKTPEQEGRQLAVDHDHKNLSIRGLLCSWCNRQLIARHRDPQLFRRAAEYLENPTGLFVPKTAPKRRRRRRKKNAKT